MSIRFYLGVCNVSILRDVKVNALSLTLLAQRERERESEEIGLSLMLAKLKVVGEC